MKLFSALLAFWLFFAARPVLADYTGAYNDYTFNYSKYRDSYNAYQIAKSTYTTYKTLTAQAEAIKKLKNVIQDRDKVMSSYYDLLQEKLLSTPGISNDSKNTFFQMKQSEKSWLDDHQKKIDAASSLEDLNTASADFTNHYPQMDTETKQAIGMVLLTKEADITTQWDTVIDAVSSKLNEISLGGLDVSTGQRGIIAARNKKELALTKISAANNMFSPNGGQKIDLFYAQQKLTEANQYLREATNYLTEIIKEITG